MNFITEQISETKRDIYIKDDNFFDGKSKIGKVYYNKDEKKVYYKHSFLSLNNIDRELAQFILTEIKDLETIINGGKQ